MDNNLEDQWININPLHPRPDHVVQLPRKVLPPKESCLPLAKLCFKAYQVLHALSPVRSPVLLPLPSLPTKPNLHLWHHHPVKQFYKHFILCFSCRVRRVKRPPRKCFIHIVTGYQGLIQNVALVSIKVIKVNQNIFAPHAASLEPFL